MKSTTAYIALGANLGDRAASIRAALQRLADTPGVCLLDTATLFETEPWGNVAQACFLNTVCMIETTLAPRDLLDRCLEIEHDLGRDRSAAATHWGPRVIDLDIILYGDTIIDADDLTIPHPEMHRRAFVLEPLSIIAPEAWHPVLSKTARQLLATLIQPTNATSG